MGWKTSLVIINSLSQIKDQDLLTKLGYEDFTECEEETFEIAMYPETNKIYIGEFNGNRIICSQDLPITFFDKNISPTERTLNDLFPDTEICALALQSTVNFWGYSISKNNQKIRVRVGTADTGTAVEEGEILEEEKELFSKSEIDKEGNRIYHFEDFPNEPFTEDTVAEEFVFKISSRYLGQTLDTGNELLDQTKFRGYELKGREFENPNFSKKSNKWIKYGGIAAFIIIWQILRRFFF